MMTLTLFVAVVIVAIQCQWWLKQQFPLLLTRFPFRFTQKEEMIAIVKCETKKRMTTIQIIVTIIFIIIITIINTTIIVGDGIMSIRCCCFTLSHDTMAVVHDEEQVWQLLRFKHWAIFIIPVFVFVVVVVVWWWRTWVLFLSLLLITWEEKRTIEWEELFQLEWFCCIGCCCMNIMTDRRGKVLVEESVEL